MEKTDEIKKLQWQCRRGMLELDVILQPFLEQHFLQLTVEDQTAFVDLLTEADPDLYTWIMGFGDCKNQALQNIIAIIRNKMSIA
ncbi:MAG: succinate dehydrogenase assembly factor 2 [Kangiellaceae bacterium]|nr:succinate dehydrogenase assembly factor 2 [Kangiellaceae bacterium]